MTMGNYCYIQSIECPYATVTGRCQDYIYDDFDKCEMQGDEMPPKEWSAEERRKWCQIKHAHWEAYYVCSKCGESVRTLKRECPFCQAIMDEQV